MIKIYGLKFSNHSAMIRFALMEKNIEHEWIETFPFSMSGDKTILDRSAQGAVPILEYDGKFYSETQAIMSFIEKKFPDISLISGDPSVYARTIEIIKIFELYVEYQARNFYPSVFFGAEQNLDNSEEIKVKISRGLNIIEKKADFNPYILGEFSYADIYASLVLSTTYEVCQKIYNWDIFQDFKKLAEVIKVINSRETAKIIYDDIAKGMEALKKS
jgi:glutathione S-transferase